MVIESKIPIISESPKSPINSTRFNIFPYIGYIDILGRFIINVHNSGSYEEIFIKHSGKIIQQNNIGFERALQNIIELSKKEMERVKKKVEYIEEEKERIFRLREFTEYRIGSLPLYTVYNLPLLW